MRLIRRHGKAMLLHQRWKLGAASLIGAIMLVGVMLVETCVHLDRYLDLSTKIGYETKETVNVINDTPPSGRRLFYPDDKVIGKWDSAGNENWVSGEYKNAPAGRKIGIIVHIIGCVYMLVGLNTVCDIYFCGALDEMVEKWQIQPDVAGATFMAAGGSAPELFTSLIGAVGVESDVGFGCIVGSAVFNVLAVIGCCGMAAEAPIKLTWWPLFRDCTFYIFGLCVLAIFAYGASVQDATGKWIGGGEIKLYEAIILFVIYLMYVAIMVFNSKLNAAAQGFVDKFSKKSTQVVPIAADEAGPGAKQETEGLKKAGEGDAAPGPPEHHSGCADGDAAAAVTIGAGDAAKPSASPRPVEGPAMACGADGHADHHKHVNDKHLRRVHHKCHATHHHDPHGSMRPKDEAAPPAAEKIAVEPKLEVSDVKDDEKLAEATPAAATDAAPAAAAEEKKEGDNLTEESEDDIVALVKMPDGGMFDKVSWILCLPIYAALYFCIPRPSPKWFLATFGVALIFIAGFSYWLVYFVEMFGSAILGGGNSVTVVMSFTLLAGGTSIPDLVSSMAVARAGEGDMAVSSSIGSNIFDILVGLPLPWMLKIGVVEMGINGASDYGVRIKSPYIALYVFLLLFMVAMVILSILCNGWYLNKKLGLMMSVLYFIFLCIVLPVELIDPVNM